MGTSAAATVEAAEQRHLQASVWPHERADASRIKLSWLLRLHWGGIIGQTLAILAARWVININVPLRALFAIVGFEIVINVGLELCLRRGKPIPDGVIAGTMLLDTFVLTALLALSGSYTNPFSTMYLVNVAIATVLLEAAWSWAILGASLALFASLFALDHIGFIRTISSLDHGELMSLHMQGMWVSFVVAAAFIVYIVQRVGAALTTMEAALQAERNLSVRKDKVASLATFAAGAAHELSTPLSTIAVVVKDLQLSASRDSAPPTAQEDLRLIRDQVARCRDILHQMSAHAGENAGEPFVVLPLSRWVEQALQHIPDRTRVDTISAESLSMHSVWGPPRGLIRALRGLVKNALQASPPESRVVLRVAVENALVRAEVVDHGCGMPAEILSRAGEPFFTTKDPGSGMGLGLFLTHTLAEQLGGKLELRSTPREGTTATLTLPLAARRSRSETR
jgi:two-component system sensor histidine kinase RegB